jgi:glycerol-3-phosphate dehydrogenase
VEYLLRVASHAFPERGLAAGDVVGAFAGLRPILSSHAETPSEASRDEEVWEEEGLLSVAGGKLTTYRSTAEEVVDRVVELLPPDRERRVSECATAGTPLVGLAPPDLADRLGAHGVEPEVASAMARRLGALSWTALALAAGPEELVPMCDGLDLCAAEVRAHLRHGAVLHLDDLLLRRARLGMWAPAAARAALPGVRRLMMPALGLDRAGWDAEEERFAAALLAWTPEGIVEG